MRRNHKLCRNGQSRSKRAGPCHSRIVPLVNVSLQLFMMQCEQCAPPISVDWHRLHRSSISLFLLCKHAFSPNFQFLTPRMGLQTKVADFRISYYPTIFSSLKSCPAFHWFQNGSYQTHPSNSVPLRLCNVYCVTKCAVDPPHTHPLLWIISICSVCFHCARGHLS